MLLFLSVRSRSGSIFSLESFVLNVYLNTYMNHNSYYLVAHKLPISISNSNKSETNIEYDWLVHEQRTTLNTKNERMKMEMHKRYHIMNQRQCGNILFYCWRNNSIDQIKYWFWWINKSKRKTKRIGIKSRKKINVIACENQTINE